MFNWPSTAPTRSAGEIYFETLKLLSSEAPILLNSIGLTDTISFIIEIGVVFGAETIPNTWILESVATFTLQPTDTYPLKADEEEDDVSLDDL